MKKHAADYGMSSDMLAKNDLVIEGALSRSKSASVTASLSLRHDLLGQLQVAQSEEFTLRAQCCRRPTSSVRPPTIGAQSSA